MIRCFAGTDNAVMTLFAVAGNASMAESPQCKARIRSLMTNFAAQCCRYVIIELAKMDYIVMTKFTVSGDTGVIIGAGRKRTRCMAMGTILVTGCARCVGICRHMIYRFTTRCNAMTGLAIRREASVIDKPAVAIDKSADKSLGIMAITAIWSGYRVVRRGRLAGRVNSCAIVVARFTWLYRRVNHAVIELDKGITCNDTEAEGQNTVTHFAIGYRRYRMTGRLSRGVYTVAGIAPDTQDAGVRVIWIGRQETWNRMTVTALRACIRMKAALRDGGSLTSGDWAVVATGTYSGYTRVIKTAVRVDVQKMSGIVAVIAFRRRRCVKFGFTDSHYAVMALAAITEYFLVIYYGDKSESQWRMAGLAQITGSDVIRWPLEIVT
jgi:hypothetical protein